MDQARNGDRVKVHYTGKLENGEVFDSSKSSQPVEFTIGNGKLIPGFEKGIIGMETGETKTLTVLPEEGYGPKRNELVVDVNKSDFPEDINPTIGLPLEIRQQDGNVITVVITDIKQETITLDANHPLAGHILFFDVELVQID